MNKNEIDIFSVVGRPEKTGKQDYIAESEKIIKAIYMARTVLEKQILTSRVFYNQMLNWAELLSQNEISIKDLLPRGAYTQSQLKSKLGLFLLNLKAFKEYLSHKTVVGQEKLYQSMKKLGLNRHKAESITQAILQGRIKCDANLYKNVKYLNKIVECGCSQMVKVNLPFAIDMAKKKGIMFNLTGKMSFDCSEDLIQMAMLGIYEAAKRFEPNKNVRFTTYAFYWIAHEFSLFLADNEVVKLPKNIINLKSKLWKIRTEKGIISNNPFDYTPFLTENIDRIENALKQESWVSINDVINEDYEIEEKGIDFLNDGQDLVKDSIEAEKKDTFYRIMAENLSQREQDIIKKRFGLNGDKDNTLIQIADDYSLTKEGVRQIIKSSIRKMIPQLVEAFGEEYGEQDLQKMLKMHS